MFHSRIIGLIAVLAAIVPASVAEAKTRQYSADLVSSPLSSSDGYPGIGGSAFMAGTVQSKQLGAGAVVDHVTVIGQPLLGPMFTFEGTEAFATKRGMLESTFTGYSVARKDGSLDVFIDGRFTGGTQRYSDATGRYTYEGTIPPGSDESTGHSHGRITF